MMMKRMERSTCFIFSLKNKPTLKFKYEIPPKIYPMTDFITFLKCRCIINHSRTLIKINKLYYLYFLL